MKKYGRTKEELERLIETVNKDFPKHYRKIEEISIHVLLTPEEAIEIAENFHKKHGLDGTINKQIDNLLFDEAYTFKVDKENRENDDIRPAWRVIVDLQSSPYLFEDYTLIVSDRDKAVMGMLDVNGHPVSLDNEWIWGSIVSIVEKNKIDGIGKSKTENKVALMIADHLDWENELEHLTLLQEKLNAYISFIESGQVYSVYPEAKSVDGFIFDLRCKFPPTENGKKLIEVFRKSTQDLKIEFKVYEA